MKNQQRPQVSQTDHPEVTVVIGARKAARAFAAVLTSIGRDGLADILFNWNESVLSEDGDRIIGYVGRDSQYSRGAEGGKAAISKSDFLRWLLSDAPFDEATYGAHISDDKEWLGLIGAARTAAETALGHAAAREQHRA